MAVKRKPARKRTPQHAHATWVKAFLTQLATNGNVTAACEAANVSKSTAYGRKHKVKSFAAQWDEAIESACDRLEAEAWRRAVNGVPSAVYSQGKYVADEIKYSDSLMQILLKAHKPDKYKDRLQIDLPPDVLKLLPQLIVAINRLNLKASDVFLELINQAARAEASVDQR